MLTAQGVAPDMGGYKGDWTPPPSNWEYIIPKQEQSPSEDGNGSILNSGSDYVSSSPEADRNDNYTTMPPTSKFNQTSVIRGPHFKYNQEDLAGNSNSSTEQEEQQHAENLNDHKKQDLLRMFQMTMETEPYLPPASSPTREDPLRMLQMSLERGNSPKPSEVSTEGDTEVRSEHDSDEYIQQALNTPKVNSHGKVKQHKCKTCQFVAYTKIDIWEHNRKHMRVDKRLDCPKCPFVTEYKHHLEYHMRNHVGSKPFKCKKCDYACVNKSMLNSHLKSHSNVYQYRCADCNYAAKYCHSLKLHLRKYGHDPAMVLNADGTPNPGPVIDVYGTRRGPRTRTNSQNAATGPAPQPEQMPTLPVPFPQMYFGMPMYFQNPLFMHSMVALASQLAQTTSMEPNDVHTMPAATPRRRNTPTAARPPPAEAVSPKPASNEASESEEEVLDLSTRAGPRHEDR